jgi:hypothetical protein
MRDKTDTWTRPIGRSFSGDVNYEEGLRKKCAVTLDFLSLPVAKSALVDCHGKELDGPYDTGELSLLARS